MAGGRRLQTGTIDSLVLGLVVAAFLSILGVDDETIVDTLLGLFTLRVVDIISGILGLEDTTTTTTSTASATTTQAPGTTLAPGVCTVDGATLGPFVDGSVYKYGDCCEDSDCYGSKFCFLCIIVSFSLIYTPLTLFIYSNFYFYIQMTAVYIVLIMNVSVSAAGTAPVASYNLFAAPSAHILKEDVSQSIPSTPESCLSFLS